jgi:acetyl esterase/lipase
MTYDALKDERMDPRARQFVASIPSGDVLNPATRDEILAAASTPEALAMQEFFKELTEGLDDETIAPRTGLRFEDFTVSSSPDGNNVKIQFIRPDNDQVLPCVYYIHGGGMATMSCYYGNYRTWGRLIAQQGVAVAMIDFRNCVSPSSVPEVAPFPAGLNDCVSGLEWVHANASKLAIDNTKIVVAGESGGGNLTLAVGLRLNREGRKLAKGLYALCPYIAGIWPQDRLPSSTENNGVFINVHGTGGRVGYGIEAYEARDPLAWPLFANDADVTGLVPTVINVNECDPLRDEGIEFYRLLVRNGVTARCRQAMGTFHAAEVIPTVMPELSLAAAVDIAAFCSS